MVDAGAFLSDPWTIRTLVSVVAGGLTGLLAVRLTFYLHSQRDLFKAVRAIRSELKHDRDALGRLATLLRDDMRRQQVDLPVEVPPGTSIEVRYVLSLPGSLATSAFDQLRRSGRLAELPPELRRELFDLYDAIDRINRLCRHREALHYDHVGNVHVVVDPAALGLDPARTVREEDLPAEVRDQLAELRRLRRATRGINTAILRLVAAVGSPEWLARLDVAEYATPARQFDGDAADPQPPDLAEVVASLERVERESFWARFV